MNGFQIGSKRLKVQHKRTGVSADEEGAVNIPISFSHNPSAMQVAGMHGMSSIGVNAVPSISRTGNQYGSAAGFEFNGEAAQDVMGYVVGNGQGQVPGIGQFPPGPPYGPAAQQQSQQSRYVYQSVPHGGGQMQHYQLSSQISETEDQAYLYP
jgi:hypothetical protein